MMGDEATILRIDHVQVTMPRGGEERARAFYGGALGLREVAKPAALTGRGGVWFACGDQAVHLGVEDDYAAPRKAHPALLVADLAAARERLVAAGAPVAEDVPLPGYLRFETRDPFGNRLEFLQKVAATHEDAEAIKQRVRASFGRAAEAYVTSPSHASGDDLARLVELAAPAGDDFALDVSTGGGHAALAIARSAGRVVASDLTPRILAAARRFIAEQGVANVEFVVADAERLPFLDETFSLVTVRIAPHHYADVPRAVREMARVLRPGGRLIMIDNIAPEDDALDALANAWEKRRDPSHVREYKASEWRGFLETAGLLVTAFETGSKSHDFAPWTERMRMPSAERAALEAEMLGEAPAVRAYFGIAEDGGHVARWSSEYVVARAVNEDS
jgi:ubiquinone/menaquinone biosynthesis C-methylase UbiE/catechol 2,3-dioxygenase-like lactoylglutathione lyase family enzyme